ncbi:MAG TPA: carbohydrate ABC transporter permease [Spirochaetia bacterium]|nr:carbohydrate ABC transporter permease [Spirochaetia bacterium]
MYTLLRRRAGLWTRYFLLFIVGVLIIYPFLWLVGASFKNNHDIFSQVSFLPLHPQIDGYINGWAAGGGHTFSTFYINTFFYVIVRVLVTVFSSVITAYGFARFTFPTKKPFMAVLIATLLFPATVILVPSYVMFNYIGWVNNYAPLVVPSLFGTDTFFVFMMIQFMRTIPTEMDKAAMIDGCGSFRRLIYILLPLLKPVIVTIVLFQFIWTWNDFLGPMIYLSSEGKFPVSVALKLTMDTASGAVAWQNVMAMSVLAILPSLIVFIFAQSYFVEGISTTGLKE